MKNIKKELSTEDLKSIETSIEQDLPIQNKEELTHVHIHDHVSPEDKSIKQASAPIYFAKEWGFSILSFAIGLGVAYFLQKTGESLLDLSSVGFSGYKAFGISTGVVLFVTLILGLITRPKTSKGRSFLHIFFGIGMIGFSLLLLLINALIRDLHAQANSLSRSEMLVEILESQEDIGYFDTFVQGVYKGIKESYPLEYFKNTSDTHDMYNSDKSTSLYDSLSNPSPEEESGSNTETVDNQEDFITDHYTDKNKSIESEESEDSEKVFLKNGKYSFLIPIGENVKSAKIKTENEKTDLYQIDTYDGEYLFSMIDFYAITKSSGFSDEDRNQNIKNVLSILEQLGKFESPILQTNKTLESFIRSDFPDAKIITFDAKNIHGEDLFIGIFSFESNDTSFIVSHVTYPKLENPEYYAKHFKILNGIVNSLTIFE